MVFATLGLAIGLDAYELVSLVAMEPSERTFPRLRADGMAVVVLEEAVAVRAVEEVLVESGVALAVRDEATSRGILERLNGAVREDLGGDAVVAVVLVPGAAALGVELFDEVSLVGIAVAALPRGRVGSALVDDGLREEMAVGVDLGVLGAAAREVARKDALPVVYEPVLAARRVGEVTRSALSLFARTVSPRSACAERGCKRYLADLVDECVAGRKS